MNSWPIMMPYRSIPVLAYHQITESIEKKTKKGYCNSIPLNLFESHIKYLYKHNYVTITLDELAEIECGKKKYLKKHIAITFDDGYLDSYTNAFPILQKFGFLATIFLVTDWIGKSNFYRPDLHTIIHYLNWPYIREMQRYGMSFQSHTCTHPHLKKIKFEETLRELTDSRKKIEDFLGVKAGHFAYPYGEYSDEVVRAVKEADYLRSYTLGYEKPYTSEMLEGCDFVRERIDIQPWHPAFFFPLQTSGQLDWLRRVRY